MGWGSGEEGGGKGIASRPKVPKEQTNQIEIKVFVAMNPNNQTYQFKLRVFEHWYAKPLVQLILLAILAHRSKNLYFSLYLELFWYLRKRVGISGWV